MTNATRPGAPETLAGFVIDLFRSYAMVRMTETQAAEAVAQYVTVLADLPAWAVERGCRSYAAKSEQFPPSAGVLRAECVRVVDPYWKELSDVGAVLDADVIPDHLPVERERMAGRFADLLQDLSAKAPQDRPPRPAADLHAEQEIAAGRPDPRPLPGLSAALRGKLGLAAE